MILISSESMHPPCLHLSLHMQRFVTKHHPHKRQAAVLAECCDQWRSLAPTAVTGTTATTATPEATAATGAAANRRSVLLESMPALSALKRIAEEVERWVDGDIHFRFVSSSLHFGPSFLTTRLHDRNANVKTRASVMTKKIAAVVEQEVCSSTLRAKQSLLMGLTVAAAPVASQPAG